MNSTLSPKSQQTVSKSVPTFAEEPKLQPILQINQISVLNTNLFLPTSIRYGC